MTEVVERVISIKGYRKESKRLGLGLEDAYFLLAVVCVHWENTVVFDHGL